MRATMRPLLAALLLTPGPASAAVVVSPLAAVSAPVGGVAVNAAAAAARPEALVLAADRATTRGSAASALRQDAAPALPEPAIAAHAAAAPIDAAPIASADESGEAQSERGRRFFDQAAAADEGSEPFAAEPEADSTLRQKEADDGGGARYPRRSVVFRGRKFRAVSFRPNVPVEAEIVAAIDAAKASVRVALYEFKQASVLAALRRARERGVEVKVILDYSNVFPQSRPDDEYKPRRSKEIWALLREGFDVKVLKGFGEFGINHNKFAVIDHGEPESLAIFGSYNWSPTAENSHYENAHFSTERRRVEALFGYWRRLDAVARPAEHGSRAGDFEWPREVPALGVEIARDVPFNGVSLPAVVLSPSRAPGESVEDLLAEAISAARRSVDVSIFALRSTKIAEALARAAERGANVRLIMDEGQSKTEVFSVYARWLAHRGTLRDARGGSLEVRTLSGPDPNSDFPLAQKNHHKFAILDGKLVETGSANYTKYAAAANFENAHFLDDPTDAKSYAFVFKRLWARARRLDAPRAPPALPTDAELLAEVEREPVPAPPIPAPEPPRPLPRDVPFNGVVFPSFAFRPDTPIEPMIVQAIRAAKTSVRLAVYEFTLDSVMGALREAKARGVRVEIVVDRSHVYTSGKDHTGRARIPSPEIQALIGEDFDVLLLKGEKGGIQHNKFLLVDAENGGLVMFGSYNLARTAEDNHYENVKFSTDRRRTARYRDYFGYMRGLAEAVDLDRLEEVLSRRGSAGAEAEDLAPEAASEDDRTSKFPPPPQDESTPVDLNGEKFRLTYFSPQGGIRDAWIRAIKAARTSIELAMFSFYSRSVADALVERLREASARGLTIRLVLDAGQAWLAKFDGVPVARWFAERGFDVRINPGPHDDGDPMFEKQHSKFIIVDGKLAMTGSFNLSDTAENNSFENENVVDDPTDIAGYVEFFERLYRRGRHPTNRTHPSGAPAPMPGA